MDKSVEPPGAATLSVVIPVFNEPDWIRRSVARVAEAVAASPWRDPEIVIVDDGSADETRDVLDALRASVPIRVIHTANRGRLLARRTGIDAARGEFILLLDARVLVTTDLDHVADQVARGRLVWNGHCEVNTGNNLLALFWDSLPRIFWSAYYADPRELSYGLDDFVKYPKGTTCFLAPRASLLEAYAEFTTQFADPRDANDDTALIEHLAGHHRIWISPRFACLYQPRQKLRRFGPHAFHRGIVFVDGYFKPGNAYRPVIAAFGAASVGGLVAAFRRPWLIPLGLVSFSLVAAGAGIVKRLPGRNVAALATVGPVFAVYYGAGIWTGLSMALRQRRAGHAATRAATRR